MRGINEVIEIPIWQIYIEHPDARIVFETGMDPQWPYVRTEPVMRPPYIRQTPEQSLTAQLGKLGLEPDDIDFVALSHLHVDHAGYLDIFANTAAKILVQRAELAYAYDPEPFNRASYWREDFDVPGLNWDCLEGSHTIVDGVELLATPGHSPGHQSLLVKLPRSGPWLLAADAAYLKESLKDMVLPCCLYSPVDMVRSMERIRHIAETEKAEVIFGHDPDQYGTLKKAPEYYE